MITFVIFLQLIMVLAKLGGLISSGWTVVFLPVWSLTATLPISLMLSNHIFAAKRREDETRS